MVEIKDQKRIDAKNRQIERDHRTINQQLKILSQRPGSSLRERARLESMLLVRDTEISREIEAENPIDIHADHIHTDHLSAKAVRSKNKKKRPGHQD